MTLRLCYPSDISIFLKIESKKKCKFTGEFGEIVNSFAGPFMDRYNLTCEMPDHVGLGDPIDSTGKYDGCIGYLQENKSDVMLRFSDYPSKADNITQGDIMFDAKMTFNQLYYRPIELEKIQILFALNAITKFLPLIIVYLMSVLLTLKISVAMLDMLKRSLVSRWNVTKSKNYHHTMNLVAHATRFGCLKGNRIHTRILQLSVSVFSLIVVHCILISIKTDLVVQKDPIVWTCYGQLKAQKVKPMFLSDLGIIEYFKYADESSGERKLWEYAVHQFNRSQVELPVGGSVIRTLSQPLFSRKAVLILDDILAQFIGRVVCGYRLFKFSAYVDVENMEWKASNFFYSSKSDPSAKFISRGVMFNRHFTSSTGRHLKNFVRRAHQLGLIEKVKRLLMMVDIVASLSRFVERNDEASSKMDECQDELGRGSSLDHQHSIKFENTKTLVHMYLLMTLVSCLVVAMEIKVYAWTRRSNKRVKRKRPRYFR